MSMDVSKFRDSTKLANLSKDVEISGTWPENLSGHVFVVAPYHRENDRHLFAGEGLIIKWDLQPQQGKIKVHSKKLKTWDSFWHRVQLPLGKLLPKAFFPAKFGFFGIAEIANTAIVNMGGRLILTADAGRYWEVDPDTLETITPIGYFDEHIVSVPRRKS
jgi:carotenoid cleavage dioxygenase-like enzyme